MEGVFYLIIGVVLVSGLLAYIMPPFRPLDLTQLPNHDSTSGVPCPPCKSSRIPTEVRLSDLEKEVAELKIRLERLIGESHAD